MGRFKSWRCTYLARNKHRGQFKAWCWPSSLVIAQIYLGGLPASAVAEPCNRCEVDGDRAFVEKRYADAIHYYNDALEGNGESLRLVLQLGKAHSELQEWRPALERCTSFLSRARRDDPNREAALKCVHRASLALQPPVQSPGSPSSNSLISTPIDHGIESAHSALVRCAEFDLSTRRTEALRCYRQFLAQHSVALDPVARLNRTVAQTLLNAIQAVPPVVTQVPSRNTALWTGGLTLWAAAYAPAVTFGMLCGLNARPQTETFFVCQRPSTGTPLELYGVLAVPILGPFISGAWWASREPNTGRVLLNWTLPWVLADGLAQIAGFAMLVHGTRVRSRWQSAPTALAVHPYVSAGGGGIAFQGAMP